MDFFGVNNWRRRGFDVVLATAVGLYGVGLFGPLFTVEKLLMFSDTVSIASSLAQLVEHGHLFLFALILCFSVLLPAGKLAVLVYLRSRRQRAMTIGSLRWIERFAKWSMLDVFVVALLVVSIKLDFIAEVHVHYGLYAFAVSVLLTMGIVAWLTGAVRTGETPASDATPQP